MSTKLSLQEFEKDYLVLHAIIKVMGEDNNMSMNNTIEIDPTLKKDIINYEKALSALKDKTLQEILPANTDWDDFDESSEEDAIETFSAGSYEAQRAIKDTLDRGDDIEDFLEEVFDGEYTKVFYDIHEYI